MNDKDNAPVSWSNYLKNTIGVPKYALGMFLPAVLVISYLSKDLLFFPFHPSTATVAAIFTIWGAMHFGSAIVCALAPIDFGARLYFPPLVNSSPDQVKPLIRMMICIDLLCGGIRFAYGLNYSSGLLFLLVGGSALIQGIAMTVELEKGTTDVNAFSLAWGGTFILLAALAYVYMNAAIVF